MGGGERRAEDLCWNKHCWHWKNGKNYGGVT